MSQAIKKVINTIIPSAVLNTLKTIKGKQEVKQWEKAGKPAPPPHYIKQQIIAAYQKTSNATTLIETGTFRGAMVEAQKRNFTNVISIELSKQLCIEAQKRFKKDSNVAILQGDSGKVLPQIMNSIHSKAVFWLDGHYSSGVTAKGDKDCPIFEEIDAIFQNNKHNHILLIDDARFFNGKGDYPTIEELTTYIKNKNAAYSVLVEHDIIRYFVN